MPIAIQRRTPNQQLNLPDDVHPLLQRIFRQRTILHASELTLGLENLLPPNLLKGLPLATELLYQQFKKQGRVLFVSDFDADGATSCALGISALRELGFDHVDYIVPNRFEYGYGLTPEIVDLALTKKPDLIVTVDNGISSVDGVAAAKAAGIEVLITDHHLPPAELPDADAIVNPNQGGCDFPSKCIAGVGVIFYVMLALRSLLREQGWFEGKQIKEPNMAAYLDLVALGTVADVVPLDRNNRIMVNEGLKRIRAGRTRPGITALLKIGGRSQQTLLSSDLGFAVGPRLNAAGRLDDMSLGIECLLSEHTGQAFELAKQLDNLNKDRKQIEIDMREQAFQHLENVVLEEENLPAALCLFEKSWHQGVVGIVASRVKDKYHRPVIAFAEATTGETNDSESELKGSARSIAGFHIRDALDAVATHNPGLINKFGGHAMAAGLSILKSNFKSFSTAFQLEAERLLNSEQLKAKIVTDGSLEATYFNLATANILQQAGPWGQEFPEPSFDGHFTIVQQRLVGGKHLKLILRPLGAQIDIDAIAFNVDLQCWPNQSAREIEIAFKLDVNEFRGKVNLQLMVEQIIGSS
jgi:single-stranded-DNA-specific exonuclease